MIKRKKKKATEDEPVADIPIVDEQTVITPIEPVETPLTDHIAKAPEAKLKYDVKWYGEQFVPEYTQWLKELEQIARG